MKTFASASLIWMILIATGGAQAQTPPSCTDLHPRIGRLSVTEGAVALLRADRRFDVHSSVGLCADDVVETGRGQAEALILRNRQTLAPGRRYRFASRQQTGGPGAAVAAELRSQFVPMAAAARERATSSQGPGDLRFTVAGLEHGQARIVEGRRSLEFRFLGTGRNFTAALTGPAGQRLLGRIADDPVNRPWRVVFPETQFRAGERWRIDVSNRFDSGTGFFTVVEGPILPSPEANGFGEDDRAVLGALILAASDVDSWSLEAFQWITGRQARRFGEEDAEYLLWLWSTDPWAVPGQDRGQMR